MVSPDRGRRATAVIGALITMTLIGGCVTQLRTGSRPGSPPASSIVHDGALTIDFRHPPTRAELGFASDRNSRSYDASGGALQVTLVFPTGTVVVPAFDVTAASDSGGGALDRNYSHNPKDFLVSRRFATGDEVRASLTKDAKVLGLSQDELDLALPQVGTGAVVPQQRVLHGLVDSWLSVDVELMDSEDGQVVVQYSVGIDIYHNAAIDKVVHDGVFTADLTRKPSRAALGMLDGYSTASLMPAWQQSLAVRLTLPTGVLAHPIDNITTVSGTVAAGDQDGTAAPRSTGVMLASSDAATAQQRLTADAPLLGLDVSQIAAVFATPAGGDRVQKTLTGAGTDVYDVSAKLDITPGGTNAFSAVITYTFTYK